MTSKKILKMIVSDAIVLLILWSIALAATFTTNVGNYKNGDYRTIQKVAASNDYLYVEKSAKWNNTDKTEATVRIEVQSKQKKTLGKLQKADILIIADKSKSAYGYYSAYSNVKDFETDVIGHAATKFVTGEYAGAGNRVAFMDFSEAAWLYTKNGVVDKNGYSYGNYSKDSDKKDYSPLWRGGKESNDTATNMKAREDNLKTRYSSIKSILGGQLMSNTDSLFLSSESDIKTMIGKAADFTPSSKNTYTNIDVPLTMANLVLERRTDKNRKAFVIFFTDGTPDPIFAVQQSKGMYAMDSSSWKKQDGMMSNPEGYNGAMAKERVRRVKNYYPMNWFYKAAGQDLRSDTEEIFFLRTGSDDNVSGQPYIIWNNITRGIKTNGTKDSMWPQYPLLPVNYSAMDGDNLEGATSSNNNNIHVIGSSSSKQQAITETDKVLASIEAYLKPSSSQQKVALDCTITDVINYDLFDMVSNSWNSNVNKSSIKYDSSKKTITWPINGIYYGDKVSNAWPYLEFKISLKDTSSSGQLNTNYIKNVGQSSDEDKSCKARTGVTEEAIDVPSPWLYRESNTGNIYANWLVRTKNGYAAITGISRYASTNKDFGTYEISKTEGNRKPGEKYKYVGYVVEDGNILPESAKFKATSIKTGDKASVTISKTNINKTVHFVFDEVKGKVKIRHVLISSKNVASLIEPNNKKYNYTDEDITLGSYSASKAYSNSNYTYKGYKIEEGLLSTTSYNLETSFTNGEKATVNLTASKNQYTITFAYVDKSLEKCGVGLEIKHYDNINGQEIPAPESRPITRKWNDLSDLILAMYEKDNNLADVRKNVNIILSNSSMTDVERITKIINDYIKPKWNSCAGVKSFNTTKSESNKMSKYDLLDDMKIKSQKSSSETILSGVGVGNTQKVPNIDEVISSIKNKGVLPSGTSSDKMITISMFYTRDCCVTFEHYDKETNSKITSVGDKYINGKLNTYVEYNPTADDGLKAYAFIPGDSKVVVPSNASNGIIKESTETNVKVGPLDKDYTIRLFYMKNRVIKFEHYDKETNTKIPGVADKKFPSVKYNTNIKYTDYAIEGYTYMPEYTTNGVNGTKLVNANTIEVGPVTVKEDTFKLYYLKDRVVKIRHEDVDDGTLLKEDTRYVKYGNTCVTNVLTAEELHAYENSDFQYRYEKVYTVNPESSLDNIDTEATQITVKPTSQNSTVVTYKYKKYWKVEIHHIDDETKLEINPPGTLHEWIANKSTETRTAQQIDYYKYVRNEVNNSLNDEKAQTVTIIGNGKVIIKFYYIKKPTIEAEIIPSDDIPLPDDPDDPSSPYNPHSPYYNKKLIVLDEIFGIKYTIKNVDRLEYDAEVKVKFPFDVYYNNKFIVANTEIVLKAIPYGSIPGVQYSEEVFFRLPSWVIEKEYVKNTLISLRYSLDPYPDGEEDPLSYEEHSITVIGVLYDFTVTGIEENVPANQARWTRKLFSDASTGIKEMEYKADTLPIGQNKVKSNVSTYTVNTNMVTQDSMWRHGLAIGTPFLFSINTKGLLTNKISIEPKLEYYNSNGVKVNNVKFIYKTIQGEKEFTDAQGKVKATDGDFSTSLTKSTRYTTQVKKEVAYANSLLSKGPVNLLGGAKASYANVVNAYDKFAGMNNSKFGSYSRLLIPTTLRLPFVDYYPVPANNNVLRYHEVQKIGNTFNGDVYYNLNNLVPGQLDYVTSTNIGKYNTDSTNAGMNQDAIVNSLGHWYAEYNLPSSLTAKDSSGKVLKDGYIVVEFKIRSMRPEADGSSKEYLAYWKGKDKTSIMKYYSSQWTKENNTLVDPNNSKYSKTEVIVNFPIIGSQNGVVSKTIDIKDGYYPVAIYEAGFSIEDLYKVAGTH